MKYRETKGQCVNYYFVPVRAFPLSSQTQAPPDNGVARFARIPRCTSTSWHDVTSPCRRRSTPFSTFIGYRGVAVNTIVKFQESVTHYAGRVQAQRRNLRNIAAHRMYDASKIDAIHLRPCLSTLLSLACRPLSRRMATPPRILPVCSSFT